MMQITKSGVKHIVIEDKRDHYVVLVLASTLSSKDVQYHLKKRQFKIYKNEDFEVSRFEKELVG